MGSIPPLFAFVPSIAHSLSVKSKAFIWIEERAKHQIDCMGAMQQNAPGVSCESFGRLSIKLLLLLLLTMRPHTVRPSSTYTSRTTMKYLLSSRRVAAVTLLSTQDTVCRSFFSSSFVTKNYSYLVENKTLMNFMKNKYANKVRKRPQHGWMGRPFARQDCCCAVSNLCERERRQAVAFVNEIIFYKFHILAAQNGDLNEL